MSDEQWVMEIEWRKLSDEKKPSKQPLNIEGCLVKKQKKKWQTIKF